MGGRGPLGGKAEEVLRVLAEIRFVSACAVSTVTVLCRPGKITSLLLRSSSLSLRHAPFQVERTQVSSEISFRAKTILCATPRLEL